MNRMSHLQPPATHDVKRESRRRLMIGVAGLLVMLLLVLLAGLVTDRARKEADAAVAQAEAAGVTNPGALDDGESNEPLADLGVAPSVDSSAPQQSVATPAPIAPETKAATAGRVPDLEPDPQLEAAKRDR